MCPQRATAGLRRTAELTDGNHDNGSSGNNSPINDSPTSVQPVTMEISSSPPLTDLERENLISWHSQEVEELHYPEIHGVQHPIRAELEEEESAEGENGKRDGDECDYLVFEIGEQKGGEEGGESERGQDTERGREEEEDGGRGERGEDEGTGKIELEDEGRGKVEGEYGSKGETEREDWGKREIEGEDVGRVKIEGEDEGIGETEGEDGGHTKEEDGWIGETVGEMKDDALPELLFISDSPVCPSSSEPLIVTSDPSEQSAAAMLQEAWGHDLGNRDDLSDGHLSDCLQAELAMVYSDSDAGEDQWAAFAPGDVTNQEEAGGGIHDSVCDGESKEEERGGDNEEREEEVEKEQDERRGGRNDDEEQMRSRRDLFLRSPSASSTASSTDPDRKVRFPPLFYVT